MDSVSSFAIDDGKRISVDALRRELACADERAFEIWHARCADDPRKGVQAALRQCRRRLDALAAESERVARLYAFEEELAAEEGARVVCGLDEVGRGPVAGPLAVGAVVLPRHPQLAGINDSKQLSPARREELARQIEQVALASAVCFIEPHEIDELGMTACLKKAFSAALSCVEEAGVPVDLALLDGNPLYFDARERNVVKGDAKCASIAAASIVAKVRRDALMCEYALMYPQYHLESCKGYASAEHIRAIQEYGLSPIHRKSFCQGF